MLQDPNLDLLQVRNPVWLCFVLNILFSRGSSCQMGRMWTPHLLPSSPRMQSSIRLDSLFFRFALPFSAVDMYLPITLFPFFPVSNSSSKRAGPERRPPSRPPSPSSNQPGDAWKFFLIHYNILTWIFRVMMANNEVATSTTTTTQTDHRLDMTTTEATTTISRTGWEISRIVKGCWQINF